jgi:Zn-dependent protease with chaperone function
MVINTRSGRASALLIATCVATATLLAQQTAIKLPKNKYTPQQDVELGLKAAAEVRQQYPIIKDERISAYLTKLGDRLVAVAPQELKQPVYQYSFTPVNLKEINAFALPGGPMFVQRGMFDAAASEGEVVGVMAHELSHVLLRHGTANATKAENPWLQIGQMAGAIGGAVVGGAAGSAISQGSQVGLGSLLLRYSRDFEKQADLLGSQIMAKAGYDPRSLAHMFETIAKESKGSGGTPQWMSSHPDPGQPDGLHHQGSPIAADRTGCGPKRIRANQDRLRGSACCEVDGRSREEQGRVRRRRGTSSRRHAGAARASSVRAVSKHHWWKSVSGVRFRTTGPVSDRSRRSRSFRRTGTVTSTDRRCSRTASSSA